MAVGIYRWRRQSLKNPSLSSTLTSNWLISSIEGYNSDYKRNYSFFPFILNLLRSPTFLFLFNTIYLRSQLISAFLRSILSLIQCTLLNSYCICYYANLCHICLKFSSHWIKLNILLCSTLLILFKLVFIYSLTLY